MDSSFHMLYPRNSGPPNHLCPINLYIFYLLSSGYTDVWPPSYLNIHPLSSAFGKSHEVSPYTTGMRRQNDSSFAHKKSLPNSRRQFKISEKSFSYNLNIHPLSSAFGKSHEVSPYTTGMRRQNDSSFAHKKSLPNSRRQFKISEKSFSY